MSNFWQPADINPICAEAQAPLTQCSQTGYMFLALITQLFGGYKRNGFNAYQSQFGPYSNGGYGTSPAIETSIFGTTQLTFGSTEGIGTQGIRPEVPPRIREPGFNEYFKPESVFKFDFENEFESPFSSQSTHFDYNLINRRSFSDAQGADSEKVQVETKSDDSKTAGKTKTKRREGKLRKKRQAGEQYDFIIVGAGSAGCVLANRLSEVKKWKILLLEAGTEEPDITQVPSFAPSLGRSSIDWNYRTQPEELTCRAQRGQTCAWLSGKVMGGSSAINYLVYMRGNKRDYDTWAELGNDGWSYREVLPYFKKSENNRDIEASDELHHGVNGPLTVERLNYGDKNVAMLVRAFQETGLPLTDFNGRQQIGTMVTQTTTRDGKRVSTNTAFINPIKGKRKNLVIKIEAQVTKVIIDAHTNIAYGVEYMQNNETLVAYANKDIIVSAGALNSPKILMLSGVGPAKDLQELNITVIKDSKVGFNLQDHVTTDAMLIELTNKTSTTINGTELMNEVRNYQETDMNKGPLRPLSSTGPLHITAFTKINQGINYDDTVPDIQLHFDGKNLKEFYSDPTSYLSSSVLPLAYYDSLSIRPILLSPKSRGYITLNKTDPVFGEPLIFPRFFTNQQDLDTLITALKLTIKLETTIAFMTNGVKFVRNSVQACSNLVWGTNDYFKCILTRYTTTIFHSVGTCKMGPVWDKNAVVDPRLRVYGIKHLRVADTSIMPNIVRGNTNAPAIMIGEKAADMIKEDLKAIGNPKNT